jgi:hypothetical protein
MRRERPVGAIRPHRRAGNRPALESYHDVTPIIESLRFHRE